MAFEMEVDDPPSAPVPMFSFSTAQSHSMSSPFGAPTPSPIFSVGGSQPAPSFSFGGPQPAPSFSFGGPQPPGPFSFGGPQAPPLFSFGGSLGHSPTVSLFGGPTSSSNFSFGAPQAPGPFSFGGPQAPPPFSFGGSLGHSPTISLFGGPTSSSNFSFGAPQPAGPFSFGAPQSQSPSPFSFGSSRSSGLFALFTPQWLIDMRELAIGLSDEDYESLLQRLNKCPGDIIRMIIQNLPQWPKRNALLAELKYSGRNTREQILPILHAYLRINLSRLTVAKASTLEGMPFLEYVKQVVICAYSINREGPFYYQTIPILLPALSAMQGLQDTMITLKTRHEEYIAPILDALAKLPLLRSIDVYPELGMFGCLNDTPKEEHLVKYDCNEVDHENWQTFFPSLQRLWLHGRVDSPIFWLSSTPSRLNSLARAMPSLTNLKINWQDLNVDIVSIIMSQAASLQKLWLCCSGVNGKDMVAHPSLRLPKLKILCYYDTGLKPLLALRTQLDACAILATAIEAPALETLGCGSLLDEHSLELCQQFAEHWRATSSCLKEIWVQHYEPPLPAAHTDEDEDEDDWPNAVHNYWEDDEEEEGEEEEEEEQEQDEDEDEAEDPADYASIMRNHYLANFDKVKTIFEGTETKLFCRGDLEYRDHFEGRMYPLETEKKGSNHDRLYRRGLIISELYY